MPRTSRQPLTGETPPRTWRRLGQRHIPSRCVGNTSTDVEKTSVRCMPKRRPEKHLHERGEDEGGDKPESKMEETPPRTWRRRIMRAQVNFGSRNTSTDVEKTGRRPLRRNFREKHLHGRGEDLVARFQKHRESETPPRTWRRLRNSAYGFNYFGNTSTDVEKTCCGSDG